MQADKSAVLLVNLGTPDTPTVPAVRRFLKEFLSNRRLIELPRLIWLPILWCFILPFRPREIVKLYQNIWQQDSPQRFYGENLAKDLSLHLGMSVTSVMCVGQPALSDELDVLAAQGIEKLLVIPLFPQYSATTSAVVVDILSSWAGRQREIPALDIVKDYWQEASWQQAIVQSIRGFQSHRVQPQKLVFSFHGIPQSYADKGDYYPARCRVSAAQIASQLGLADDQWVVSFQSRFGAAPWVQPYTDATLCELARQGNTHVQVVCPGFSMDCLETLDEVQRLLSDQFIAAGGERLEYIPALNDGEGQRAWVKELVERRFPVSN